MKKLRFCTPIFRSKYLPLRPSSLPDSLFNSAVASRPPKKSILYASLLQSCTSSGSFSPGLQIHSHVLKSGLNADRFVGNSLLSFYFKLSPDFSATRKVFDALPARDVISWTSMVSGYVRAFKPVEALHMFNNMVAADIDPNAFTLSASIKACSALGHLRLGRCFHGMVLSRGFEYNSVIASTLLDMYGSTRSLNDMRWVFDEMLQPDAVCWTTMISALTRNDQFDEALACFCSMIHKGANLVPDEYTFGTLVSALGNLGRARQGKEAHGKVIVSGFGGNVVVESSLVDMYAKCGLVPESCLVFDHMPNKNAVSWCALLDGYCQSNDYEATLALFREMEKRDHHSFGTVLRACAGLAAIRQGKQVHCQYTRMGVSRDVIIESALVDLYAKCGSIEYANRVFTKMPTANLITWNAMICGFAQNGRGLEASKVFDRMIEGGTQPDYISFIGVLFGCGHSGMVEDGRRYFKSMTEEFGIPGRIEHYNCMVDLLSRVGLLEEAEDLIDVSAYRDDLALWSALLGACYTYSNETVAERVAKRMMELDPRYHLSYVLLANLYKKVGQWDKATKVRKLMRQRGATKTPGKSWIAGDRGVGCFPDHMDMNNEWLQEPEDASSDGENAC